MILKLSDFESLQNIRTALKEGVSETALKQYVDQTFSHEKRSKYYQLIQQAIEIQKKNSPFTNLLTFTSALNDDPCFSPLWVFTYPEDLKNMETTVQVLQNNQCNVPQLKEIIEEDFPIEKDRQRLLCSINFADKIYQQRIGELGQIPYSLANFMNDKAVFEAEYPPRLASTATTNDNYTY